MTEKERNDLLNELDEYEKEIVNSKEFAIKQFIDAGIIDANRRLTDQYKPKNS